MPGSFGQSKGSVLLTHFATGSEFRQDNYHSRRNQFERFRDSKFVVAEIIFFERFEFLVCSKFNHKQCGRTCACVVACLCPHNYISNVVVAVTTCIYIYIQMFIDI